MLGLLSGCEAVEAPSEQAAAPADVTLTGVRLTHWQGGRASAHSTLASVAYDRVASRALAFEVVIEPLDEQGRPDAKLTARRGDGHLAAGLVELEGDVRWTSGADSATTEACTLDLGTRLATGPLPVRLEGPGFRARGDGFTAELSGARRMTLTGGVRAHFDEGAGP